MALVDDSSILMSIKQLLNVEPEEMGFDTPIGMFINEEFMTLSQLGIGPENFSIVDADTKWKDFSDDKTLINTVKTYIYYRVRMVFDPPASSIVADSYNQRISELQFRLNCQAERNYGSESEEENQNTNPSENSSNKYSIDEMDENLNLFSLNFTVQGGEAP